MFSISLILALRKTPRVALMLLLFITVFLLSFLLMGCTKTSSSYSDIYLAEFEFNSTSAMYPLIETAYENQNYSALASMKVRANYLALCVEVEESLTCSDKADLTPFQDFTGVSFFNSDSNSSSTTLNLIDIAAEYSQEVVKPYVLIATLIITIFLFLNILYCSISFLPLTDFATKLTIILSPIDSLVWGIGCMWNYIGGNSVKYAIEPSSMAIVTSTAGSRAQTLTWASFAFIIIVTLGCLYLFWRDRKKASEVADEEKLPKGRGFL